MLGDLMSLMSGMQRGNHIARTKVNGFVVSTVVSADMGPETAIIDANETYPVERYASEDAALEGHEKWIKSAVNGATITKLGYKSIVDDEQVVLVAMNETQLAELP
jgi:hypothetical protein